MQRLLENARVLDLTSGLAGPHCTRALADLGAEIIKVEPPDGDPARALPPDGDRRTSATFFEFNCGKAGVSLDLAASGASEALRRLLSLSDALIEDWDAPTLAAAGLSPEEVGRLFPGLVHCSITPYGRTGPYAERPGSGLTADAVAGILGQTGFPDGPPLPLGYAFGEINAGIHAAAAVLAALFKQRRQGTGQHVDISMAECSLNVQDTAVQEYLYSDRTVVRTRGGVGRSSLVPYGVYTGPDGHMVITGWERLWAAVGRPDMVTDPRFATPLARERHKAEVWAAIEGWLGEVGSVHEAERRLQASDMVAFKVRSVAEAVDDPQIAGRELLSTIDDPERGPMRVRSAPFHLSDATAGVRGPAPRLGEHNEAVLRDLCGLD